jgi:signal transduction histidine kinase
MRERSERTLHGWTLAVFGGVVLIDLLYVVVASGVDVSTAEQDVRVDAGEVFGIFSCGLVGLFVTWARPRNPIGWLISSLGVALGLADLGQSYGARAVLTDEGLPLGTTALSLTAPLWIWTVTVPVTLLLARYPSGQVAGRWVRRFDRLVLVSFVPLYVGYATSASSVTDEVPGHLPPVHLPEALGAVMMFVSMAGIVLGILVTVVDAIVRAVRADRRERLALVWLTLATVLAFLVIFFGPEEWMGSVAFFGILVAVAVGVLRYQAMGIEVVVRRTLIYATLTGLVLLVFVGLVAGLAQLLPSGPTPQLIAAVVIAVGLTPARDRIQRVIDRLLYGDRGDPLAALTRLGSAGTTPEELVPEVLTALADGLHASGACIDDLEGQVIAAVGVDVGGGTPVALELGGEQVGVLRVGPRSGEAALAAADVGLLEAVAPLVAAVVRSARLATELGAERARVIEATHHERSRLRQDLHDGLGPSLTGVGLGLEALSSRNAGDPEMVARLRSEVSSCLDEIHRIIDDLRPSALDDHGLVGALEQRVGQVAGRSGLTVVLEVPPALPEVGPDVEAAAFRIADEALTNVVRHAAAQNCTVSVSADGALSVVVVDDGRGIGEGREGGVGLASMRARAERLGGRLTLTPLSPGTEVRAELPLEATS